MLQHQGYTEAHTGIRANIEIRILLVHGSLKLQLSRRISSPDAAQPSALGPQHQGLGCDLAELPRPWGGLRSPGRLEVVAIHQLLGAEGILTESRALVCKPEIKRATNLSQTLQAHVF